MEEKRPLPALPSSIPVYSVEGGEAEGDEEEEMLEPKKEEEPTEPKPARFRKLHRRAGKRFGYWIAETKHRFVITDNLREVAGLCAMGVTIALMLLALLIGRAFDLWSLFVLAAILGVSNGVWTWFMVRITTTLDRRTRRMVVEKTFGLCRAHRTEYDLADVVRATKRGEGRQAVVIIELSSGEEVAATFTGLKSSEELKTIGPDRLNRFLKRVRGEITREYPPPYVLGRAEWKAERDGDISIGIGTFIKVLEAGEDGWWKGKLSEGVIGMFPAHFTVELAPSELPGVLPPPPTR